MSKVVSSNLGLYNVLDYGAKGDTVTNDTAAIQAAIDAAYAGGGYVYFPYGVTGYYKTTATLNYKAKMVGQEGRANARGLIAILPTMTDGSAGILVPAGLQYWCIENLKVASATATTPATAQNCIGIKAGTFGGDPGGLGSATAAAGGMMRNVTTRGFVTGFELQGWNATYDFIVAEICQTGLKGEYLNASKVDFNAYSCAVASVIEESQVHFTRLFDGGPGTYRTGASLIDGCDNFLISDYYSESDGSTAAHPWLKVGTKATTGSGNSGQCVNFTITAGVVGTVTSGNHVEIDRANGFYIGLSQPGYATATDGTMTPLYSVTANSLKDRTPTMGAKDYTPTWAAAGGSPNKGTTGTLLGNWSRTGTMITATVVLTFGGTGIDPGTGEWTFTLPKAARSSGTYAGTLKILDAGTAHYTGSCIINSNLLYGYTNGVATAVGAATPIATPAAGDVYVYSITYESV